MSSRCGHGASSSCNECSRRRIGNSNVEFEDINLQCSEIEPLQMSSQHSDHAETCARSTCSDQGEESKLPHHATAISLQQRKAFTQQLIARCIAVDAVGATAQSAAAAGEPSSAYVHVHVPHPNNISCTCSHDVLHTAFSDGQHSIPLLQLDALGASGV
jgi:hypothetical protein